MAFEQSDIDNLKAAIARGVRKVRINGEEVEYNSFDDMRRALRMMEAEVNATPRGGRFKVTYPKTSRGL